MICRKGREVRVLQSNGWYIGTADEEGPYCRISEQYYASKDAAQDALDRSGFSQRNCVENNFCNGGQGCFEWPFAGRRV